jgi:hypothetical protein
VKLEEALAHFQNGDIADVGNSKLEAQHGGYEEYVTHTTAA